MKETVLAGTVCLCFLGLGWIWGYSYHAKHNPPASWPASPLILHDLPQPEPPIKAEVPTTCGQDKNGQVWVIVPETIWERRDPGCDANPPTAFCAEKATSYPLH